MAHLTNFSFEFVYEIFTEDASLPLLYQGAKKVEDDKNSNQGGSCLNCGTQVTLVPLTKLLQIPVFSSSKSTSTQATYCFDLIKAGATQTKTSLRKQYVACVRVDLLDDYDLIPSKNHP